MEQREDVADEKYPLTLGYRRTKLRKHERKDTPDGVDEKDGQHHHKSSREESVAKGVDRLVQATEFFSSMLAELDSGERATLSDALGSDSIRFNELTIFLNVMGQDMVALSTRIQNYYFPHDGKCTGEVPPCLKLAKSLKKRFNKGLNYINYFLFKLEDLIKQNGWRKANIIKIILGLLLIGASIASIILVGGGDAYLILLDALAGGAGISLLGRGIKEVYQGIKSMQKLTHLQPKIKQLREDLKAIKMKISDSQITINDLIPGLETDKPREDSVQHLRSAGIFLVQKTAECERIPETKNFMDWICRRQILLSDLDRTHSHST